MSNHNQALELTNIRVSLLEDRDASTSAERGENRRNDKQPAANQGLTMDRDASTSTLIIDETIGFLLDCAKKGENLGKQRRRPPSICKVSRIFRDLSVRSFIPQLVSIGPIHRENKKLKEFEWQKECYLNDLLNRCDSPKKTLEACLERINDLIPKIRESYADVKKNYSDVELAKMMVMDGCFILEFCFKLEDEENAYLQSKMQTLRIALDLMLLENQVPFVVLQALFNCLAPHMVTRKGPVNDLSQIFDDYLALVNRFHSQLPLQQNVRRATRRQNPDHILGYLHTRCQLAEHAVDEEQAAKSSNRIKDAFHSIVELYRSGMNFKPHQEDEWSMTIKFQSPRFSCLPLFWGKPTLLMPTLVIGDSTELILRNLIAYEQSFPHVRYYFTSYAYAMDKLIDSQEDIAKLVESKVLVNMVGSNQEAADMINKICKNISIPNFYYYQVFKQVDKYYNRFWPKHIAKLRRIYFSNPWSAIALFGAIILFILTVVSTIFTVLQYIG